MMVRTGQHQLIPQLSTHFEFFRLQPTQRERNDAESTDELDTGDHQGEAKSKQHRRRVRLALNSKFDDKFHFLCKKLRKIP